MANHSVTRTEGSTARRAATTSFSVSLPNSLYDALKEAVGSGTVSSYVARAVEDKMANDGLEQIVADYVARTGRRLTEQDMTRVDREWEDSFAFRPVDAEATAA